MLSFLVSSNSGSWEKADVVKIHAKATQANLEIFIM
jgi:hypothetical protein